MPFFGPTFAKMGRNGPHPNRKHFFFAKIAKSNHKLSKPFYFMICFDQESFIYQMEWVLFRRLFWSTNDSIAKLTISFTIGVSLWDRPCYYDSNNIQLLKTYIQQFKIRFLFILTQILAFVLRTNMVRDNINVSKFQKNCCRTIF